MVVCERSLMEISYSQKKQINIVNIKFSPSKSPFLLDSSICRPLFLLQSRHAP
jgi:hypothetical protein